jgi:hypothetical protein
LNEDALCTFPGQDGRTVVAAFEQVGEIVGAEAGFGFLFPVAIVTAFGEQGLKVFGKINSVSRAKCSQGNCGQRHAKNETGRLHELWSGGNIAIRTAADQAFPCASTSEF